MCLTREEPRVCLIILCSLWRERCLTKNFDKKRRWKPHMKVCSQKSRERLANTTKQFICFQRNDLLNR